MRFFRRLGGGEPLIMDVPVYDATDLVSGELVMEGAQTGATGHVFIAGTGATGTAGLGVLQETVVTTADASTGFAYAKCIVNPDATYLSLWSQASGDVITANISASTGTTLTITSLEDDIDGGWIYVTDNLGTCTGAGQLRYISASAAGSCTLDSAATIGTDSDIIKIAPVQHLLLDANSPFTHLESAAAAGAAIKVRNIENYVEKNGRFKGIEPLRRSRHRGLNDLNGTGKNPKFYAELVILDHCYTA